MTYDELLDKIAQAGLKPDGNVMPTHLVLALYAVVELHKPLSDKMQFCMECKSQYNGESDVVVWPCLTIKAIEKELQ